MGSNKPLKPSSKLILENIPVHNTQCRLPVFYQTHSPIVATFVLVGYTADLYHDFPEIFSCAPTFLGTWQLLACSSQQLAQLCNAKEKIQELRLLCISSTAKELLAFKMVKWVILNSELQSSVTKFCSREHWWRSWKTGIKQSIFPFISFLGVYFIITSSRKQAYCIKPKPHKISFYKDWLFRTHFISI